MRRINILPTYEHEYTREPSGEFLKVAAAQIEPRLDAQNEILEKICNLTISAATEGASLIVFPELSLTGLMKSASEIIPGPSTKRLASTAKNQGVHIVAGLLERYNKKFYNTAVLFGPNGIVGKYRKIHPWYPSEAQVPVQPGDGGYPVFNTDIGKIGMMICYDAWFPEPARVLALKGAEIIVVPTSTGLHSAFDYILRTRALENHVWIVAANGIATVEDKGVAWKVIGRSQIVSISGEVLAEASCEKEETIYARIDVKAASQDKQLLPGSEWKKSDLFAARKPKTYDLICAPK
jgi:predicted amidohydrolase